MISRAAYREHFKHVIAYDLKLSKCPEIVFNTLNAGTADAMSAEMEVIAQRSRRVEKPCAHFCFSLAPGEVLSAEQWAEFFAAVVEEFGAMQAFGVTHADTPQVNAHLVMNRVKFDGRTWGTSNDRKRLRSLCGEYEKAFGLRILPVKSDAPRINKTEIEKADRLFRQGKAPTPIPARMALSETIRAVLALARSREDFTRQLEGQGITVRWRIEDGRITGTSYAQGDVSVSGKNAGITVRAVREQFSLYEHDRITPPSGSAPALDGDFEGAIKGRAYRTDRSLGASSSIFGAAERPARKAYRGYADDSGDVAASAGEQSLIEILSEATRYGCLGLLGLLSLVIAGIDDSPRFNRPRPRRMNPSIPI